MICPKCGEENKDGVLECSLCHEKFYHGPASDVSGNEISNSFLLADAPKQAGFIGKLFRFLLGVAIGGGAVGGGIYAYNVFGEDASSEESSEVECIRDKKYFQGEYNGYYLEVADYDCKDGTKFKYVKCRFGLNFSGDWVPSKTYHSCRAWEKKSNLPSNRMQ